MSGPDKLDQTRKATASGWIGSALEFYDFFIYATAASIIFPQLFFPSSDPKNAIIASLATFGVGYVARPIGAFFLGHWGDTHGRKNVLLVCMFVMGASTMGVGLLPTYDQAGITAPILLVVLRLLQGFAVAGEITGASSMILEHAPFGRRGYFACYTLQGVQAGQILAAAVFLPLAHYLPEDQFNSWGWRIPFLLSFVVLVAGYVIRRNVEEPPVFANEAKTGEIPKSPIVSAFRYSWRGMLIVLVIALMNVIAIVAAVFGGAYATQKAYGIGFHKDVYLWIPILGNITAVLVIPFFGKLSDKYGRRPMMIFGALGSGALSFFYLYAISIKNLPLSIGMSLLMWGVVYQGYNANFPCFFPELFPARHRVSGMAIAQNVGVFLTSLLPALFAMVAPPGTDNIPLIIGSVTFFLTILVAIAAWAARENSRIRLEDLGDPNAVPVSEEEYHRYRLGLQQ